MSKLLQAIERNDRIAIAGHVNSDGDSVGATLGLWNYIRKNYPEKHAVVYLDSPEEKFSFIKGFDLVRQKPDEDEYDCFIMIDCSDVKRLGQFAGLMSTPDSFCVDHHVTGVGICRENDIRPDASSASEIIYELIDQNKIDRSTAECLYMGIAHDTGVFHYSCTSKRTMEIAGRLMSFVPDFSEIIDKTFYMRTHKELRVIGYAFDKSVFDRDIRFISTSVSWKEMKDYGVSTAELESISSQLRCVEGVETAAFIYQTGENEWKASLRSQKHVDVAEIAHTFGGGGHKRAAGCTFQGTLEEILPLIKEKVSGQMKDYPQE